MPTFAERFQIALTMRGLKQADIAAATGIGKSSISTYLSGEYEPKQRNVYKIAEALNVDESWLMGFGTQMERKLPQTLPPQFNRPQKRPQTFFRDNSGIKKRGA